ncbi:DUF11 domain-containing protein [Isosphaeraceae bacterium EP7]
MRLRNDAARLPRVVASRRRNDRTAIGFGRGPTFDSLEVRALLATIPIYSTGVAANGELAVPGSAEVHFQLVSSPTGANQNFVMNPPPDVFVANGPTSQWIGPTADPFLGTDSGDFVYRQTFDLTGLDPTTAVLHLQLASDNDSRVFLNGVDTNVALIQGSLYAFDYETLHPFTIATGFRAGYNTLEIVVHNDYSATGLRLDLSGTADPADPSLPVYPANVSLASAVQGASTTAVQGTLTGARHDAVYTVEFFAGMTTSPPLSVAPGVPAASITVTTDSIGTAGFSAVLPTSLTPGQYVFARAISADGAPGDFSAPIPVTAHSDLSVTYLASASTPVVGEEYPLTFRVTNNGPSPATGVALDETFFDDFMAARFSAPTGPITYDPRFISFAVGRLEPGESVTLIAYIAPAAAGTFRVVTSVRSDSVEVSPGDETLNLVLTVAPAPLPPPVLPDLSVEFLTTATTPVAGVDYPLTFRVTNHGQATATEVRLSATIPGGLALTASAGSTGQVSGDAGTATLIIPSLAPGESATLTISVRSAAAGAFPVTALATSAEGDAHAGDETAQLVLAVAPTPPSITKSDDPTPPSPPAVPVPPTLPVPVPPTLPVPMPTPIPMPGPVVTSVRRFGVRRQLTQVILTFDQPLDPVRAIELSNYQVVLAGADGKFQTADDRRVSLALASYNPEARTVTLVLNRRLSLQQTYQVVARGDGPRGVADLQGQPLNSSAEGIRGLPYRAAVRGYGPVPKPAARLMSLRRH